MGRSLGTPLLLSLGGRMDLPVVEQLQVQRRDDDLPQGPFLPMSPIQSSPSLTQAPCSLHST